MVAMPNSLQHPLYMNTASSSYIVQIAQNFTMRI